MAKTINKEATKEEIEFFESFSDNANLSDNEEDYLQYGFFHLTSRDNIKIGKDGTYESSIESAGLLADIGENSKDYEEEKRVYYSIGALGVCGIINRGISMLIDKLQEGGMSKESATQKSFKNTRNTLNNNVYLKINARDGIEYDSNDFMTIRNSHTISNITIPQTQLEMLNIDGSSNGLNIFEYFYKHCESSKIRLGKNEKNYLDDFMDFVHDMDEEDILQTESTLKKLNLGEVKRRVGIDNNRNDR